MSFTRLLLFSTVVFSLVLINSSTNAQQFDEIAKWVPESANALVMVRSKKILESPIAKKENWKLERLKQFKSGASFIPPEVDRFLMASQVDFEYADPIWQIAIFERLDKKLDVVKISERIGGNLEKVADHDAVALPNDAYAVKLDDVLLGAMVPANRQATARWLRKGNKATQAKVSPYLTEAVKFADKNADIIVAFDFSDSMNLDLIKQRIGAAGICEKSDLDSVCEAVATVKGATLGITIKDKISAAIKVDFDGSPDALTKDGKAILISALTENGLMIDDFSEWESKVMDDHMVISGPLSDAGLRQIGILIEHPIAADFVSSDPYGDESVDMKTRSKQYFDAVHHLLDEMQDKKAKALTTYAKWFEKYAKKVDDLSVVNVDPKVIEFGTYVSDSFREVAMRLLDTNYQKAQAQQRFADRGYTNSSNYRGRYGYGRGGYRNSYFYNNSRNRARVSGQARLAGQKEALEIINQLESEAAKVRKEMSTKYNFDF